MKSLKTTIVAFLFLLTSQSNAQILEVEYTGFTIWLDCEIGGAVRFEYFADADAGNEPRHHRFRIDDNPEIEDRCQQTSSRTYSGAPEGYDRGHLVPANHLDHDAVAIRESNFMTNILPQHRNMNRGAWLATEEIIECVRDQARLHVIGGVIWGYNPHDDFFVESHDIQTPDYFWKFVKRADTEDAIAWIIPNVSEARRNQLDKYIISISELELITGGDFDVSDAVRNRVHFRSWQRPQGCNLG